MATLKFSDIVDTRSHPYSIARSYSPPPIYDTHGSDTHPSNSLSVAAIVPPPTPSRSTPFAARVTSVNRTGHRKPFRRLLTTRSLSCVGSPDNDDDHCHHMIYTNDTADVNEHDNRQSFFEGMDKVDRASKQKPLRRTCSMADISLKSIRSWFASIGDHLSPPPMVERPQSERPYHYRKRSLRRAVSFHNGDIGDPSPDEQTVDTARRRAGTLGTTIRAIESASYIPASPFSTNAPNRSSGSYPLAFDDIDSVSSRSLYSPTSSPASPVHRVILFTEYKEDKVEKMAKDARREYAFEQPLAASFDSDKPPASPLGTLRPRTVSFSRPTPQVYPHLICQATARQESLRQVVRRSPVRVDVPLETTPEHCPAPLSPPPLPNRNPKRTPSDSGHGPLIHATLDQSFRRGGQAKFTQGPNAVVLK